MDMGKHTGLALAKGPTRKQIKAKKDRAEGKVEKAVRAACVERDGCWCRAHCFVALGSDGRTISDKGDWPVLWRECVGPSEHAHMHSHRRSQTRGQAAERRHTTAGSLMLCRYHHQEYDAHRLLITCLTRRGADGPLKFRRAK